MRAALCALAALLSGCGYMAYFIRPVHEPIDALEVRADPARRSDCLLVMMPGLGDTPDLYLDYGFVEDARAAGVRCDFVLVDAHVNYYGSNTLRPRVGQDILWLAHARGYREIWMVGISMGGLGSLLVARDHPGLVRGVVLIAPFLGDEEVARSIAASGGLARWEPPVVRDPESRTDYSNALWGWLRGYLDAPEDRPQLYLGVGTEDSLLPTAELLEPAIARERFLRAPGGHRWTTWRAIWRALLEEHPFGR